MNNGRREKKEAEFYHGHVVPEWLMVVFNGCCISQKCVYLVPFSTQALEDKPGVRFSVEEGKCLYHCLWHCYSVMGDLRTFLKPHVQKDKFMSGGTVRKHLQK